MSEAAASMLALLRDVVPPTSRVVAAISVDEWSKPTPCEEMTVHELAAHLVGGLEQFGDVADGLPVDVTAITEIEPGEISARLDAAADRMLEQWSVPGVADVVYPMPWGDTPGVNLIGFMVIEVATHGWDLARATGRIWEWTTTRLARFSSWPEASTTSRSVCPACSPRSSSRPRAPR